MNISTKLFVDWDLGTWANVLEIVGFLIALVSLIIGLFIRSEINKLKTNYIFDKRIKNHLSNLENSASLLSRLLNDYDNNTQAIRTEFGNCISELEDTILKISFWQGWKSRRLISFLKSRRDKPFDIKPTYKHLFVFYLLKYPQRLYKTTYDDVWIVYNRLIEIVRQLENIKRNKAKSL